MIYIVLIALVVAVAVILGLILRQPSSFTITRSGTAAAPVGLVFDQINTLRNWEEWSPWAKLDPEMQLTYDGPPSGVGAGHTWKGNKKVGQGSMRIVESVPGERISIDLRFVKPMKASNPTTFTFSESGGLTTIHWAMSGTNTFMGKVFWLLMDIDKLAGRDFERGLANLKEVTEAKVRQDQ